MLIPVPVIIVRVDHAQMLTQLVHDTIDVAAQVSVARIKTDTHIHRIHGGQNPKKIAGLSKQKMR